MAITSRELNEFTEFVGERIKSGDAGTLVALASEWEARRRNGAIAVDAESLAALAAAFPDVDDDQQLRQAMSRKGGVTTQEMLRKAALAAEAQQG
jgi:hypothetical protein